MSVSSATARIYFIDSDPTAAQDGGEGYEVGNFWQNTLTLDLFIAMSVEDDLAVWKKFSFAS